MVLTEEEEAAIVAFRNYTLLPLDKCLYALRPTVPQAQPLQPLAFVLVQPAVERSIAVGLGRRN